MNSIILKLFKTEYKEYSPIVGQKCNCYDQCIAGCDESVQQNSQPFSQTNSRHFPFRHSNNNEYSSYGAILQVFVSIYIRDLQGILAKIPPAIENFRNAPPPSMRRDPPKFLGFFGKILDFPEFQVFFESNHN